MNRQKLKSILKKNEITCKDLVCTAKGFSCRGLTYRGDSNIPYDAARMVAIAVYGYGYSLEVNQRDRGGKTHYQFAVERS